MAFGSKSLFLALYTAIQTTFCQEAAQWMSGGFGIGVRHPPGWTYPENCDDDGMYSDCIYIEPNMPNFDASKIQEFVDQMNSIEGLDWVMIGLSRPANGDQFLAWHSILTELNPGLKIIH